MLWRAKVLVGAAAMSQMPIADDESAGRTLREYAEVRSKVADLSYRVGQAHRDLTDVMESLADPDDPQRLIDLLYSMQTGGRISSVAEAADVLGDLRKAVVRKRDLASRLAQLGYRDIIRP